MKNTEITIRDHSSEAVYRERIEGENEMAITVSNTGASSEYLKRIAERLRNILNCVAFKEDVMGSESFWSFHRKGEVPPAIMVPTLASRSVSVNMKPDPYSNNKMPTKLTVRQGETVVSKPSENALLISMALDRFDTEVDGSLSEAHYHKEAGAICEQLDSHLTASIVKELVTHKNNAKYLSKGVLDLTKATTSRDRVELVEDAIDKVIKSGRMLGATIEDWVIGLEADLYRDFDRIARRSGCDGVEDFLGTTVTHFVGTDLLTDKTTVHLMMAPKRSIAASFRENAQGIAFDFIVSRDASKQSSTLEMVATADLLIAGFTKAKADTGEIIEVSLPLVSVFTSKVEEETPPPKTKKQ